MADRVPPGEGSVFRTSPIELVTQDMKVVDVRGQHVGKVAFVKMGDPDAVTTAGIDYQVPGFIRGIVRSIVGEEPDVPEPMHSQLLRTGFIKVEGKGMGFFDDDRYVPADRIARVDDDTVYLSVEYDKMLEEEHPGGI